MTEDEIKKLEEELFKDPTYGVSDPDVEREWLKEQHAQLQIQTVQIRAAFRLHKFLRDDAKMRGCAEDLKRCLDALKYIDKRMGELS